MRSSDIKIGGEYAYSNYATLRKVRVLEKGVATGRYPGAKRDGVRFEVVIGPPLRFEVVKTRDIAPWEDRHDKRLAHDAANLEREQRINRIAERLGVTVQATYNGRVAIVEADFVELATRLGVETD